MKSKSADKQAGEVVGICKPYIPRPITGQIDFSSSVFSRLVRGKTPHEARITLYVLEWPSVNPSTAVL